MSARKKTASANPPASLSEELQECFRILKAIEEKSDAGPFMEPVDWQSLGLLDYPQIIKTPMDLGTVEKKLVSGKYSNADKFAADVRLVWKNAKTYNRQDSAIYLTADSLSKFFEKRMQKIKRSSTPAAGGASGSAASAASAAPVSGQKRKRADAKDSREVTRQDRVKFSQLINQLSPDQLGQVVGMLQRQCPEALNEENDDELEIEINNIDGATLLALNDFATECINGASKKRKK